MCMEITTTERLLLREICEADKERVFHLSGGSTLLENTFQTEGFAEIFQQYCWEEVNAPNTYNCMAFRRDNGEFIGKVCMQYTDKPMPELGIDICKEYRGQGYGPEVIIAFCNWYAKKHQLPEIKVRISKNNTHSIHVFEKLGARFIGSTSFVSDNTIDTIKEFLPDADMSEFSKDRVREYIIDLSKLPQR